MGLRAGYKLSDVGEIPNDWQIYIIKDLIELLTDYDANGSFESVAENVKTYDYEEYAWYVRSTDLENNSSLNKVKYVDKQSYKFLKKTTLYGGELLFLKRGDIGNVYLFEMKTERATVAPNLYLLKLNQISDSKYLYYYFISKNGQLQLKSKNASSTLGALYKDDVKSIIVPLPPTKSEQTAIATALSDADALISSIEKLIAKKRDIKQGAMQKLLQPKEGWEVKKLGELFEITSSKRVFQSDWTSDGIPFYRARELAVLGEYRFVDNELFITTEMYDEFKRQYGVPEIGDMLVTGVGTLGKTFLVTSNDKFYFKDGNIIWFKIKNSINSIFLQQLYLTPHIKKQIEDGSAGTTVGTYTISGAKKTVIPFPPKEEQTRIANILSDMDAEITALETKLEKYKKVKLGMMQNLLTGKIRLI